MPTTLLRSDPLLSTDEQNSAGWLARSASLGVSLLVHIALLMWLLSSNLAGNEAVLPPTPLIAIELVKMPPPPPPPDIKTDLKPDKKPLPKRAARPVPKEEPGPPVHEISTKDDEWVAPRVNNNKSFVIGARRVPSDYADKVKGQVIANMEYPEDAVYKSGRSQKGPPARQQCRIAYEITVDRNGNMMSYKFDRCGSDKLDAAAEAALKKSGPFPPPPDLGAETYVIYGVQIFRLK